MNTEITFTKKDLVVTIFCIVFMLMNLGAIAGGGRWRAKKIVCLSNLRKWGEVFHLYAEDNDGATISDVAYLEKWFPGSEPGVPGAECWASTLLGYYEDRNLLLCPSATKPWAGNPAFYGRKDYAWDIGPSIEIAEGGIGSYGINDACYGGPADSTWGYPIRKCWKTFNVAGADNIPVLSDCAHIGHIMWDGGNTWGSIQGPPTIEENPFSGGVDNRVCMDRHGNRTICVLFADCSVRTIGLKEIWTLRWNKHWPIANKYTWAGYPKKDPLVDPFPTKKRWPPSLWNAKQY